MGGEGAVSLFSRTIGNVAARQENLLSNHKAGQESFTGDTLDALTSHLLPALSWSSTPFSSFTFFPPGDDSLTNVSSLPSPSPSSAPASKHCFRGEGLRTGAYEGRARCCKGRSKGFGAMRGGGGEVLKSIRRSEVGAAGGGAREMMEVRKAAVKGVSGVSPSSVVVVVVVDCRRRREVSAEWLLIESFVRTYERGRRSCRRVISGNITKGGRC